ncbi:MULTISPECIES: DUF2490 domain-containing protein [Flavobacteriaceae]|uniref:DUF2490 domain-containing protein n=1 Tax=Flavobacteriaceae TaxID=49546 RepID=UPI0014922BE3|nr:MULTISPECIES: DUF2490 domain-containing protein [Allomuricauda]MDC6367118.1 DUF2490 domain-containing protein [Muricauda sp. AC10]
MRYTKRYCILLLFLIFLTNFPSEVYGQLENEKHTGTWMVFSGNTKIHENWRIPTIGILTHQDMLENYNFSFFRTGISYQASKSSTLTGGVAFLNSSSYSEENIVKNSSQIWFYGEYTFKTKLGEDILAQRVRLENRRKIHSENPNVNNRLRYRLQYVKPINSKTYLRSFNELFLHLEGTAFDQNRLYIGMGQKLSKSLKMDIGYLKRFFKNSNEGMVRMELTFNVDLTKNDLALNPD